MKVRILRSSVDGSRIQFAASYVINESVAIDAGSLGFTALKQQLRVRHVVLSHSHLDHISSLPAFLDNVYASGLPCPTVYGGSAVIECLKRDFFNDRIWPDVNRLSREDAPYVRFVELQHGQPVELDGLRIIPVNLNHVVPCFGFLMDDGESTVALVSDTGPTDMIWKLAGQSTGLRAVFLEAAFPNSLAWLADQARHLTPELLLTEFRKLGRDVPLIAIHIKPVFYEQVVSELRQLGLPTLVIGEPDFEYEWS